MPDTGGIIPTRRIGTHRLPDGREIVLYGFGLIEWRAVQEAALAHYKRELIRTITDNLDLFPEEIRHAEVRRANDEAKKVTLDKLPTCVMKTPLLDDAGEIQIQDRRVLLRDEAVDYVTWWSSDTVDGKLHCLWLSARKAPGQESWTKQDLDNMIQQSVEFSEESAASLIEEAAQTVGRLSQSELAGNSSSPVATATMPRDRNDRRERRRRRRENRTGA